MMPAERARLEESLRALRAAWVNLAGVQMIVGSLPNSKHVVADTTKAAQLTADCITAIRSTLERGPVKHSR